MMKSLWMGRVLKSGKYNVRFIVPKEKHLKTESVFIKLNFGDGWVVTPGRTFGMGSVLKRLNLSEISNVERRKY